MRSGPFRLLPADARAISAQADTDEVQVRGVWEVVDCMRPASAMSNSASGRPRPLSAMRTRPDLKSIRPSHKSRTMGATANRANGGTQEVGSRLRW